jgi:hypothetical protein
MVIIFSQETVEHLLGQTTASCSKDETTFHATFAALALPTHLSLPSSQLYARLQGEGLKGLLLLPATLEVEALSKTQAMDIVDACEWDAFLPVRTKCRAPGVCVQITGHFDD